LKSLQRELNSDIIIVLQSNSRFRSDEFWNTLIDLGLKWGDGDLFHWTNYESGVGDDNFFSVWTSTEPGYFLPEDVAKGTMNLKDLIFGFSIPRSPDPINVFEIVIESVEHCQSRLGGSIVDENGTPFDKEKYETKIRKIMSKMNESGFEQGQGLILRLI
jgi:cell division protein ZipA